MELVIEKANDRPALVKALCQMYKHFTHKQAYDITCRLPYTDYSLNLPREQVVALLKDAADFSIMEDVLPKEPEPPFAESEEYRKAYNWYKRLSKNDKKHVNHLIKGTVG